MTNLVSAYTQTMLDYLARILAPEVLIESARGETQGALTSPESQKAQQLVEALVKPGDIILTRTPSNLYSMFRDLGQTNYDHALAIVDQDRCLHVTYPNAKLVPTRLFFSQKKNPLILRPKFNDLNNQNQFILNLKNNIVGKTYDYNRVLHYFISHRLAWLGIYIP